MGVAGGPEPASSSSRDAGCSPVRSRWRSSTSPSPLSAKCCRQVHLERRQPRPTRQGRAILIGLFREKGFSEAEASAVAATVFADPELALATMVREEIGMDMKSIGSPMVAATGSFIAFVLGASSPSSVPGRRGRRRSWRASCWASWLFFPGWRSWRFTGHSWLFSGARQVALGGVAAVTYFVGAAIGTV
jgi:hypothetical protein